MLINLATLNKGQLLRSLVKNRAEILAFANEKDLGRVEFVEETASGRTAWRDRKIATVLDGLGTDDILIVSELSRIGLWKSMQQSPKKRENPRSSWTRPHLL